MRGALLAALLVPALAAAQPKMPGRWHMQLDKATLPNDYTFTTSGGGWHMTTGSAAGVVFDPQVTATGAYHAEATFTQNKAPQHPEAYGLIFGGKSLTTPQAEYYYYVVRGDGKYLVKHRAPNGDVHTIKDWTASPALKVADANGRATNALRVDVAADSIRFSANGARVAALPAFSADGIVGLRVNHALDVQIDGLKVGK